MLSCNKDKTNSTFNKQWHNLRPRCHQLQILKQPKSTTANSQCKLDLTNTIDYLNQALNTITNGKPSLLFSHTSKEIMLGTLTNTITSSGLTTKLTPQKLTNKVLNIKNHIQQLRTQTKARTQRTNSSDAKTTLLKLSNMLNLQTRRDSP